MAKSKIFIEKNNYDRVVVTDLLPYETPLIFSNDGYYKFLNNQEVINNDWINSTVLKKHDYTLPFNYKIKKSYNSYRTLSVMHPNKQKDFVRFYEKYDFMLISLCSRSPFTLRKPVKVAGQYYENDETLTSNDIDVKASSNYFHYADYSHMYKFFDSYEFHRLEKKYNYFMSLDISKCFYNIYTHSICWAVKDKDYAKKNGKATIESFENTFDTLMQKSNYNETNGILVGPEISRIFAEIIFQKIDLQIEEKLFTNGLKHKVDYAIKRYIDDYFIWVNDKKYLDIIKNTIQEEAEFYKLYLNDSKTNISEPPFMTNITMAKMSISDIMNKYFDIFTENDEDNNININNIGKYFKRSHKMIEEIKKEIKSFDLKYNDVNNFILKIFNNKISFLLKKYSYSEDDKDKLINFFMFILDVVYFIYPMDVRINTTYNLSHIIININEFLLQIDNKEISFTIKKKIIDESLFVISKVCNKEKNPSLEVLNLLLIISHIGNEYLTMDEKKLQETLHIQDEMELNYFQIVTLLFFIKDTSRYSNLKKLILQNIKNKLKTLEFIKTENYLLFFDILSCPHLNIAEKKSILPDNVCAKQSIIDSVSNKLWFTDWNELNMKRLLHRKELKLPYER